LDDFDHLVNPGRADWVPARFETAAWRWGLPARQISSSRPSLRPILARQNHRLPGKAQTLSRKHRAAQTHRYPEVQRRLGGSLCEDW
jgi:hypothetical protein